MTEEDVFREFLKSFELRGEVDGRVSKTPKSSYFFTELWAVRQDLTMFRFLLLNVSRLLRKNSTITILASVRP